MHALLIALLLRRRWGPEARDVGPRLVLLDDDVGEGDSLTLQRWLRPRLLCLLRLRPQRRQRLDSTCAAAGLQLGAPRGWTRSEARELSSAQISPAPVGTLEVSSARLNARGASANRQPLLPPLGPAAAKRKCHSAKVPTVLFQQTSATFLIFNIEFYKSVK